ncbi:MAG TPA: hypothetical protein VIR45_14125 [Kiloniellaceae bacterium]
MAQKLPIAQRRFLERVRKNGGVHKIFGEDGITRYFFINSGALINARQAEAAIGKRALVAVGDGMFGETQTYQVA